MILTMLCAMALVFASCEKSSSSKLTTSGTDPLLEEQAGGNNPATDILTESIRKVPGPKRLVAVGRFDAIGACRARYADEEIGEGIAAMMTTALFESERFIVVERANINQILAEQEMTSQGLTGVDQGPQTGKLIPVQWMLYGSVTELGMADKGGPL